MTTKPDAGAAPGTCGLTKALAIAVPPPGRKGVISLDLQSMGLPRSDGAWVLLRTPPMRARPLFCLVAALSSLAGVCVHAEAYACTPIACEPAQVAPPASATV